MRYDPLTFLAKRAAGHFRYAFSLGENVETNASIKAKMPFDQYSIFLIHRITCLCPEPVVVQILEGNELIHSIAEGKEYSTDVKNIRIKRLDALSVKFVKVEKGPQPVMIRLEGDLYPAGVI